MHTFNLLGAAKALKTGAATAKEDREQHGVYDAQ